MDQLFEAAFLAIQLWRALLCAVVGALVAFLLSQFFPSLPTSVWFALTFGGAAIGIVWQAAVSSAREAAADHKAAPISKPVAFLGIALVGGLWGSAVASAAGASVAVLTLVIGPALLGPLFGHIAKQTITPAAIAFATMACVTGFAAPYAIRFSLGA